MLLSRLLPMAFSSLSQVMDAHLKVSHLFRFKAVLRDPKGAGHYLPSWEPLGRWEQ